MHLAEHFGKCHRVVYPVAGKSHVHALMLILLKCHVSFCILGELGHFHKELSSRQLQKNKTKHIFNSLMLQVQSNRPEPCWPLGYSNNASCYIFSPGEHPQPPGGVWQGAAAHALSHLRSGSPAGVREQLRLQLIKSACWPWFKEGKGRRGKGGAGVDIRVWLLAKLTLDFFAVTRTDCGKSPANTAAQQSQ